MGYVANIPGNICGPLAKKDTKIDEKYLANALPSYYQEDNSRGIAAALSSPTDLPIPTLDPDYLPSFAKDPLKNFKNTLYDLHIDVQTREQWLSKTGRQSYTVLDPDYVANSIQI